MWNGPSAISRKSQASDSSQPPPMAEPFSAATTTAPAVSKRDSISPKRSASDSPDTGVRPMAPIAPGTRRSAATVDRSPWAAPLDTGGEARAPASSSATS